VQRLLVGAAIRREAAAVEVMDAWADYLAEEQAERADAYERAKDEQVLSLLALLVPKVRGASGESRRV
jgi:mono/diheme cytochrome c family protein